MLGGTWVSNYIRDWFFLIDLTSQKGDSYIDKSRVYALFPHPNHQIVSKSMLIELNNYFKNNQRFKVDKEQCSIEVTILPGEKDEVAWKHGWYAGVNVHELCHQLCSIQFQCRDGSCFGQHHRNNIHFNELYKLLDWFAYERNKIQCYTHQLKKEN